MSESLNSSNDIEVLKVDAADGIVYGMAIVSTEDGEPYYDIQGDHIPEDVMRKAATKFMLGARNSKAMHGDVVKGMVVHSLPLTTDIAEALGMDDIDKTGWIIGMKPADKSVLRKFEDGEYTGFSIGGKGRREKVEDE